MSESRKFLRKQFNSGKVYYCSLAHTSVSEDIGFISSNVELNSAMAAFAAKNGVSKVTVFTGHNIMNCGDGPSAEFDVKVMVG